MTAEIQDYWKKEKKKSLHSVPIWLLSSDMDALHAGSQLRFEQQIINKSYNETGARETGAREGPKNDIRRQIFLLSRITEKESYFGTFYRNLQVSATNMFKIHVMSQEIVSDIFKPNYTVVHHVRSLCNGTETLANPRLIIWNLK